MNGVYGLINTDGAPIAPEEAAAMRAAIRNWSPDTSIERAEGAVLLGCTVAPATQVDRSISNAIERQGSEPWIAAAGRIDNRDDLMDRLGWPAADRADVSDQALIRHACARWGADAPNRLFGDWSFAAWDPRERRLLLARDHYGNTSLYYSVAGHRLAFASDRRALLALPWVDRGLDELFLAHTLVAWPVPEGDATIHAGVRRVPPAHTVTWHEGTITLARYWRAEDVRPIESSDPREYAEGLRHHLAMAVDARLRSTRPVAIALSGGIDSAAVASLAAPRLSARGDRLLALTATALSDQGLASDLDYAGSSAIAAAFANIDHHRVTAEEVSPLDGVERFLSIHGEPGRAVANHYWLTALLERARDSGCGVLLTGQSGNATISWTGGTGIMPALEIIRQGAVARGASQLVVAAATAGRAELHSAMSRVRPPWRRYSSIEPRFASRMNIADRMRAAGWDPTFKRMAAPRAQRLRLIRPVADTVGAIWAQLGMSYGLEVRDPTHDVRLLQFALSIPDRHWQGAQDRHLIRRATEGIVPDAVRREVRRGRQAGDLVPRLLKVGRQLDGWLEILSRSELIREYVDVDYLKESRKRLDTGSGRQITNQAATVLLRGLCCGIYLSRLGPVR